MKGLTLLWMCLCCLRPDDVANVLPQSAQAWARAPACCERMCLCRLLGSVNTCWGEETRGGYRRPRGREVTQRPQRPARYLGAVLTLVVLPAVVRHLVADQVGLPVEGLGALVTAVLPLLRVGRAVGLQAAGGHTLLGPAYPRRPRPASASAAHLPLDVGEHLVTLLTCLQAVGHEEGPQGWRGRGLTGLS